MFQIALGRLSLFTAPFKFYARPRRVGKTSPESAYEIIPFHRNTATDSLAPTVTRGEEGCRSAARRRTCLRHAPVSFTDVILMFFPGSCAVSQLDDNAAQLTVAFCSDDHWMASEIVYKIDCDPRLGNIKGFEIYR